MAIENLQTEKAPNQAPSERAFWLAWSQITDVGPILIQRLHQTFGTLSQAWVAEAADLLAVEGIGLLTVENIVNQRRSRAPMDLLQQHQQENPHFWTPADADYPRLLREIPDPPPVLYYRGTVDRRENLGEVPSVAIVGTRQPTEYGRRWTRRLTTTLVEHGFIVVSGLAEGIDAEAHRACLAAGGRTWAVMGTGVNIVYPWTNKALGRQILEQGLVLSEHPMHTPPDRAHFPRRNRIIAGLCRATLVLEAPQKSGALITAHVANDYGRDVYILPGSLDNPQSLGCLHLLSKGAQPILDETHLLELLGSLPPMPDDSGAPSHTVSNTQPQVSTQVPHLALNLPPDMPPEQVQILQAIAQFSPPAAAGTDAGTDANAVPFDWLVQTTGLPAGKVSSALLQLEMQDWVIPAAGLRYRRR